MLVVSLNGASLVFKLLSASPEAQAYPLPSVCLHVTAEQSPRAPVLPSRVGAERVMPSVARAAPRQLRPRGHLERGSKAEIDSLQSPEMYLRQQMVRTALKSV